MVGEKSGSVIRIFRLFNFWSKKLHVPQRHDLFSNSPTGFSIWLRSYQAMAENVTKNGSMARCGLKQGGSENLSQNLNPPRGIQMR